MCRTYEERAAEATADVAGEQPTVTTTIIAHDENGAKMAPEPEDCNDMVPAEEWGPSSAVPEYTEEEADARAVAEFLSGTTQTPTDAEARAEAEAVAELRAFADEALGQTQPSPAASEFLDSLRDFQAMTGEPLAADFHAKTKTDASAEEKGATFEAATALMKDAFTNDKSYVVLVDKGETSAIVAAASPKGLLLLDAAIRRLVEQSVPAGVRLAFALSMLGNLDGDGVGLSAGDPENAE